jgi:hypothetical protein
MGIRTKIAALSFGLALVLGADVGGLQVLPVVKSKGNIARNGGFENATGDWTLGPQWSLSNAAARTGTHGLAVTNVGGSFSNTTQRFQAVNMRMLRLRAWLKTSGNPGPNASFVIGMSCATDKGWGVISGQTRIRNLSGGLSNWTQYTLEDNITWGNVHYGHIMQVALQTSNIAPGTTLYVDDVTIEPVYVPLTIFPTYPNYRGMLWSDQGLLVKWNAIVEPPPGSSTSDLEVVTEILDAVKCVRATVNAGPLAAVDETGGLSAKWPGASLNPQSFDATALADGVYYLRGKLLKSGAPLYTYPDYKIVKEAPSVQRQSWTAWVDRYNRAVLNGRPSFIWGGFLQPNHANNTYAVGRSDPFGLPESYEAIAISNPPFSAETPTVLKVMQDLKMNADIYFGNLSGANIGIEYNLPAAGTVTTNGTKVTGAGTSFTSHFGPGDVIVVAGLPGTGTVALQGEKAVGAGTRFTSQLRPFDWVVISGRRMMVSAVVSDTELMVSPSQAVSAPALFTYDSARAVTAVAGNTSLTVDAPFAAATGKSYTRSSCSRYNSRVDYLSPYLTAAERSGISHLQIVSNFHRRDPNLPTWARYCRLDAGAAIRKMMTHAPTPVAGRPGWLGLYVADEPSADSPTEGLAASYTKVDEARRTTPSFGGVNYWVDGWAPVQTWNQWNNVMDASGPDPYPVGFGPLADDLVYGIPSAPLHGRSYWWPRRVGAGQFEAKPLWTTIQLFRPPGSTLPSAADQKIQVISALAAGSTGIFWWTIVGNSGLGSVGTAEYYAQWHRGGRVIASLMPLLEQPVEDLAGRMDGSPDYGRIIASVSDPAVKCSSRQLGAQVLLACVNTTNRFIQAALTLKRRFSSSRLAWDNTALPVAGNIVNLAFTGLQDAAAPQKSVHLIVLN